MVHQDGGVDRAMQSRRAQPREQGTAVDQDQIKFPAQSRQSARPARAGQEVPRSRHGGPHRQEREVIVARVDQGFGQGLAAFDDVIKTDLGAQAQEPRQHRPGEIAIDQNRAGGMASQSAGQRQHESRPAFRSMAACEEKDFQVLLAAALSR